LLGEDLQPFPPARPREPSRERQAEPLRKNRTWVSMGSMAAPPFVLAAVPPAVRAMNDLAEAMYLTPQQMADPDIRRGELHRTQIELVAATVSHVNECFY
jgi:alkylhydroperoxidase family enzyme